MVGQSCVKAAAAGVANSVNVELRRGREVDVEVVDPVRERRAVGHSTNELGAPAGGRVLTVEIGGEVRLLASRPPVMPGVMNVAGFPASIAARSNANGWGPRNAVPDELNTFMVM